MNSTTQASIVGQVQSIEPTAKNDYLINFVTKVIQEGEPREAWFNVRASPWKNWQLTSLKEGDEVEVTGQLTREVWQDPFNKEEVIALYMVATDVSILAA